MNLIIFRKSGGPGISPRKSLDFYPGLENHNKKPFLIAVNHRRFLELTFRCELLSTTGIVIPRDFEDQGQIPILSEILKFK